MAVPRGSSTILRLGRLLPPNPLAYSFARRALSVPTSFRSMPLVERDDVKRVLSVTWDKDTRSVHPFTWLKDYCHCSACAHPSSLNRRKTLQTLDLNCIPQDIVFNDEKSEMTIAWNDGHESFYPYKWLADRCFVKPKAQESFPVKTWGKGFEPQRLKWSDVVNDDRFLYRFLLALKTEGVCMVSDAPSNDDGLNKLVEVIGYPWNNHYGEYFDVISKNDPSNIAYTPETLSPHIDLPYYEVPPGSQFLHCITRTPDVIGGENQLVDGFHVAEVMRREDPKAYQLLCDIAVHYWDFGSDFINDFHLEYSQKVIQFDPQGNMSRIVFSTHFRDSKPCVSLEKVEAFYRALKDFETLLYRESIVHHPVQGDIVVVDNHRVLHGRSDYRVTGDGMRYVRGTYIAWDILNSRFRRLHAKLI